MSDTKLEIILTAKNLTGGAFKKVGSGLKKVTDSVLSFNGAMGAAAGAAGLGYFVKKNLEAADSIAKTADTIGITTKSLQEYRFMADRSGVAVAQLDQGLGAFSKRLGELRLGTGALNTILSKGNGVLKEQMIAAGSTDKALEIFLDTLGKIEDQSDKTALSAAAFSRTAGIKMTNLVKGGSAALDDMRQEFLDLGLVIDEKWLRQSEKAIDQFTNLEYAVKARLMSAVVQTSPQIIKMVGHMTDWVVKNDKFLTQDVPGHIKNMGKEVQEFTDSTGFKLMMEYWQLAAGAAIGFRVGGAPGAIIGAGAGAWIKVFGDLKELTAGQINQVKTLQTEYEFLSRQLKDMEGTVPDPEIVQALEDRQAAILKQVEGLKQLAPVATEAAAALTAFNNASYDGDFTGWNEGLNTVKINISEFVNFQGLEMQRAIDALKQYETAQRNIVSPEKQNLHDWFSIDRESAKIDPEEYYQDWADKHNAGLEEQKQALEKSLAEQADDYEDFSDTVQDYTADIIDNWGNAWETMADIVKRTVSEMAADLIAQKLIVPIAMDIGSAAGLSWKGTKFGDMAGGSGGGIMDKLSSLKNFGSLFGGNVPAGSFATASGIPGSMATAGNTAYGLGIGKAGTIGGGGWGAGSAGIMSSVAMAGFGAIAGIIIGKVISSMAEKHPAMSFMGSDKDYWKIKGNPNIDEMPFDYTQGAGGISSKNFDYQISTVDFGTDSIKVQDTMFQYFDTVFAQLDAVTTTSINDVLKQYKFYGKNAAIGGGDFEGSFKQLSKDVFSDLVGTILTDILPSAGTTDKTFNVVTGSKVQDYIAIPHITPTGENASESTGYSEAPGSPGGPNVLPQINVPVYSDITRQVSTMADTFNAAFFAAILPSGGNEWDALTLFAKTVQTTDDFIKKFNDRMTDFSLSAVDAFTQIAIVSGALGELDQVVADLEMDPVVEPVKTLSEGFETLTESLKANNATVDDLSKLQTSQDKIFWATIKDLGSGGADKINAMADAVKGFVWSSDQIKLQGIASQGEQITTFFDELYTAVKSTGNATFISGVESLKGGVKTIVDTLMQVSALDMYSGHLKTIGGAKANIFGMENEWSGMNIGSKYGADLGSSTKQADFVKSVLGLSPGQFISGAGAWGVSVEEAAADLVTLADIVKDTAKAFEDIGESLAAARLSIIGQSSTLSPDQQFKNTYKAFQAAGVLAMSTGPNKAADRAAGAKDLVDLSGQVLAYKEQSTTSFFEYKAIESDVLSTLKKVEDFSKAQVKLLDLGDPAGQLTALGAINTAIDFTNTSMTNLLTNTVFTTAFDGFNNLWNDGAVFNNLNSKLLDLTTALNGLVVNITTDKNGVDTITTFDSGTGSGTTTTDYTNSIAGLNKKYNLPAGTLDKSHITWWENSSMFDKAELADAFGLTSPASIAQDIKLLGKSLNIPGYAGGGDALGLSIVGEQGPELINFKSSAAVHSNNDTGKIMAAALAPVVVELKLLRSENQTARMDIALMRSKIQKFHLNGIPVRNSNEDLTVV